MEPGTVPTPSRRSRTSATAVAAVAAPDEVYCPVEGGAHCTARGEARRRALIDAAARMFLDQGYEAVSLDDLIRQVGGSRRNIYAHFGGKKGLFVAVVTQLCAELGQSLRELDMSGHDERTALTLFGARTLALVLSPRALALHRLMIAVGARFPEIGRAAYEAGPESGKRLLGDWIAVRQAQGRFRADISAFDLGNLFLHMLVAGPQQRVLSGVAAAPFPDAEIARLTAAAVDVFLSGVGPSKAGAA